MKRNIFKVGAFILCLFFFVAPLVQCSGSSKISATGWQMLSNTGELMKNSDDGSTIFVILLIILPVIMLILAFTKKSFTILRNVSVVALIADIIFLIVLHIKVNSGSAKGGLDITVYNWLILFIYIGMVALAHSGIQKE